MIETFVPPVAEPPLPPAARAPMFLRSLVAVTVSENPSIVAPRTTAVTIDVAMTTAPDPARPNEPELLPEWKAAAPAAA